MHVPSSWKNPYPLPAIKGAICITNTCHETSERLTTAAEPVVPGQLLICPVRAAPMHPCLDPSLLLDKHTPQIPVLILILCYPSMLSQQQVRDESPSMRARSMPRTTEATRCYPIHFASPWTTSEETTVLWISSISDRATAETTWAQCRCDDHTQDTAHEAKWSLHGQLMDSFPAQMEGYERPGKVVSTDSKTSRSLGRVAWKVPGRGPTEHPTKISRLTQRSLYTYTPLTQRSCVHTHTHIHTHTPLTQRSCTHTHTHTHTLSLPGLSLVFHSLQST